MFPHNLRTLLICTVLLSPAPLWAHGEETPGPHGGHIQMPGAFHTEVSIDSKQEAHIYLLDINFQNPTVKDSSVTAVFKNKNQEIPLQCSIMDGDHFHCKSGKVLPKSGQLIIRATREKAVGNEAVYKLPLKPFPKGDSHEEPMDHSHHH